MDHLQQDIESKIADLERLQTIQQKNVDLALEIDALYQDKKIPTTDPIALYQANMDAFKEYIPDIYNSFANYRPEKFELAQVGNEYHLVDGENNLVLGQEYYRDGLVDFEKYRVKPMLSSVNFDNDLANPANFIHVDYLNQFTKMGRDVVEEHQHEFRLPEAVNMMVCFGLGLGYYIPLMLAKHKVKRLYIYEPENDLFYASLFSINWAEILTSLDEDGSSLHLCLGTDEDGFFADISKELILKGRYDATFSFCYKHYETEQMTKAMETFNKRSYELAFGLGFFDDSLLALAHQYHNLNSQIPLLANAKPIAEYCDKPVFILANGPSLDTHIEYIKANRDKVILVSGGTTLRALHQYDIKPDFHIEMERTRMTHSVLKSVGDDDYIRSIPLLTLNTMSPDVGDLFDRKIMGLKMMEASTAILMNPELGCNSENLAQLMYCNPTVSNLALSYFVRMGFKNIYLFGVDLGFAGESHHSKKSIYYDKDGKDKQFYNRDKMAHLKAPGNFVDEVETTIIFQMSAKGLDSLLCFNPDVNCYNLSNGIKLENAPATLPRDVVLPESSIDKIQFINDFFEHYGTDSSEIAKQYSAILEENVFSDFVDELVALMDGVVSERYQALNQLHEQFKVLHSKYGTKDAFLADMLRGTLHHCHALLIKVLLLPVDPETGLKYYNEAVVIYKNYLLSAQKKYNEQLLVADKTDISDTWK